MASLAALPSSTWWLLARMDDMAADPVWDAGRRLRPRWLRILRGKSCSSHDQCFLVRGLVRGRNVEGVESLMQASNFPLLPLDSVLVDFDEDKTLYVFSWVHNGLDILWGLFFGVDSRGKKCGRGRAFDAGFKLSSIAVGFGPG